MSNQVYRCRHEHCSAFGRDITEPKRKKGYGCTIAVCGFCHRHLSLVVEPLRFDDPVDPDRMTDKIELGSRPMISIDADLEDLFCDVDEPDVEAHHHDIGGQAIADAIDKEIVNEVTEWARMRDGIDDAEIALKGFCQEIGANMLEDKIRTICRKLQDLVYQYHGLGD